MRFLTSLIFALLIFSESYANNNLKDFFHKAFYYTPSKRMTLEEMSNHNWLKLST